MMKTRRQASRSKRNDAKIGSKEPATISDTGSIQRPPPSTLTASSSSRTAKTKTAEGKSNQIADSEPATTTSATDGDNNWTDDPPSSINREDDDPSDNGQDNDDPNNNDPRDDDGDDDSNNDEDDDDPRDDDANNDDQEPRNNSPDPEVDDNKHRSSKAHYSRHIRNLEKIAMNGNWKSAIGTVLKADGSNFRPWLTKLTSFIKSNKLIWKAFSIPNLRNPNRPFRIAENASLDEDLSSITDEDYRRSIKKRLDPAAQTAKELLSNLILSIISDDLTYLVEEVPRDPAIQLASIRYYFDPADAESVQKLLDGLDSILAEDHANFPSYCNTIRACARKLRSIGETISDARLKHVLFKGLPSTAEFLRLKREFRKLTLAQTITSLQTYFKHERIQHYSTVFRNRDKRDSNQRRFSNRNSNRYSNRNRNRHNRSQFDSFRSRPPNGNHRSQYQFTNRPDQHSSYHDHNRYQQSQNRSDRQPQTYRGRGRGHRSYRDFNRNQRYQSHPNRESSYSQRQRYSSPPPQDRKDYRQTRQVRFRDIPTRHTQEQDRNNSIQEQDTSNQTEGTPPAQQLLLFQDSSESPSITSAIKNCSLKNSHIGPCGDSGATSHSTSDLKNFSETWSIPPRYLIMADGSRQIINTAGNCDIISTTTTGETIPIRLTNVLYAPNTKGSFISIPMLDKKGCKTTTFNGIMKIHLNGKEIGYAPRGHDNLYRFQMQFVKQDPKIDKCQLLQQRSITLKLAHQRLAHISKAKILATAEVTTNLNISDPSTKLSLCVTCDECKTNRKAITSNPLISRTISPSGRDQLNTNTSLTPKASRLNSDLKTLPTSSRGYNGFAIYIESDSRMHHIRPYKRKSDVPELSKAVIQLIENQTGRPIKIFRSDNGGEYTDSQFQTFLLSKGIKFSPSPARTPEMNGIAERGIQSVLKMIRCMLHQARLPQGYWCYTTNFAEHIINRIVHTGSKSLLTPIEASTQIRPDLSHLRIFGCIAVTHIDAKIRRNRGLSNRGLYVRVIGYGSNFGTYNALTKTRKHLNNIRISKFYESVFTFPTEAKEEDVKEQDSDSDPEPDPDPPSRPIRSTRNVPLARPGYNCNQTDYPRHFEDTQLLQDALSRSSTHNPDDAFHPNTPLEECIMQISSISINEILDVPSSFKQAMQSKERDKWLAACKDELSSLLQNKTWDLITTAKRKHLIGCRWVFRKKLQADQSIRYKARLVAKGFSQLFGRDYEETYASNITMSSLRLLLAIASRFGLHLHNLDIITAYLYALLDKPLFMKLPPGYSPSTPTEQQLFHSGLPLACRLRKSIYGLKQSGHLWYRTLTDALLKAHYKPIKSDMCIFQGNGIIIGIYTDDLIIGYRHRDHLQSFLQLLTKHFKFRDLGPLRWTLGMEVQRDTFGKYSISQSRYINSMAEKFSILPSKAAKSPMSTSLNLYDDDSPAADPSLYRSILGSLLYATVCSRPDCANAVSRLSSFCISPRIVHMKAATRVIQFMLNTCNFKIRYGSDTGLEAYSDASFATDLTESRSYTGFFINYANAPIIWGAHKQTVVAPSPAAAEYMAAAATVKDIIHARNLLKELNFPEKNATTLHVDNTQAIIIAKRGVQRRSRSIRLAFHLFMDEQRQGTVSAQHIEGKHNPADLLTKPLSNAQVKRYCIKYFFI